MDRFGRRIVDLRISVTDRCNLRCRYCMGEEGVQWFPREAILTFEEIERVARVAVGLGVCQLRLTGGEPTVRAGLVDLVRSLSAIEGVEDLSMTTNGLLLEALAAPLREAGLQRINVSLDTLDPDRFQKLTRHRGLEQALRGLAAARAAGLHPIKINVVALRDFTEEELLAFARFAREEGYPVRFIEFMPLDGAGWWSPQKFLPATEIVERIAAVFPLQEMDHGAKGPATVYRFSDGCGEIGVIPSVTCRFCSGCDRLRLTTDGALRTCLFGGDETDLRLALRSGADDAAIAGLIVQAVTGKAAHRPDSLAAPSRSHRSMCQIGG